VPAISVEQAPEVEAALRAAAGSAGTPLRFVNREIEFSYRFGASPDRRPQTRVCLFSEASRFEHVPVPLPGEHQAMNCGAALAVIDLLKGAGYDLPDPEVHTGLAATAIPGRMELLWERPRVIVDGAHNPASVAALMRSIGAYVPYDSMVCIFGCCEDKDIPAMLDRVALGGDKVIFTRARNNPRAAHAEELQRVYTERCGKMSQIARTLPEALNIASRAVGRDDLICVTGSFYLVGEAKKHFGDLDKRRDEAARPARTA
jgi:dihydrofolate synthase/folylpolyglutamate synthase